ncbi:hypothetical protein [Methanoculleus chikugoensis]|uniref:hypothetical protein n=1 Tax=Methanoculleus chikugoensis TaxID=118126 RepID=UPI000AF63778|nr:hypothetical protein [Methanoculleus chikugoensis]
MIAVESPRTFTRRDGTPGEMVEAVIGNEDGVFRLVAWAPDVLLGGGVGRERRHPGGGRPRKRPGGDRVQPQRVRVRHALRPGDRSPPHEQHRRHRGRRDLLACRDGGVRPAPPHSFVTRNGRQSSVRNLVIVDPTGEILVVVWGEKADEHLMPGDRLLVYNATARRGGRYGGDLEVHLSWGGSALVVLGEEEEIEVTGTVIATRQGIALDAGDACYLLREPLPVGYTVRARGTVHRGGVISPSSLEAVQPDPEDLQRRLDRISGGQPRS